SFMIVGGESSQPTSSLRSPRASVLQQTASDLSPTTLPNPVRLFPIRRCSRVLVAALQKTHECVCCRPTSRTLLDRSLQQQPQTAFHTELRVYFRRLATTNYICVQWPSLKVRGQDSRAPQLQTP